MSRAGGERQRAAALARHYRGVEHLSVAAIAARLHRRPSTISAYLYDPDGSKTKHVKARYRGVCSACGASTWGSGPGAHGALCASCNGRATAKWDKAVIEDALRAWAAMFGAPASSADLSIAHAKRAARRDGGLRLRRLHAGWAAGRWPAASVVQYHYGTVAAANDAALPVGDRRPQEGS
ncbi:MAG TPA: hypothetical protein VK252_08350 [Solirubrobacteraceae bacterium]|nr:hypothetical protein [Solirubrobacteraceae bacterium]